MIEALAAEAARHTASMGMRKTDQMEPTMERYLRAFLMILFVAAGPLALSACNTVEGAGEDISSAGKAISNTADDTKKSM